MTHTQRDRCEKEERLVLRRHRFKTHEWLYISSERELIELLRQHKKEFALDKWRLDDIHTFLQLRHFLYPRREPAMHHIRCIATLISDGKV